jgi:hypothetical protein
MRSPFPVPSYDTMMYWCLLLPKALPASSSPAWLKEPQLRSPRRWGIGWEVKRGVGPKGPGADMPVGKRAVDTTTPQGRGRACV